MCILLNTYIKILVLVVFFILFKVIEFIVVNSSYNYQQCAIDDYQTVSRKHHSQQSSIVIQFHKSSSPFKFHVGSFINCTDELTIHPPPSLANASNLLIATETRSLTAIGKYHLNFLCRHCSFVVRVTWVRYQFGHITDPVFYLYLSVWQNNILPTNRAATAADYCNGYLSFLWWN